MIENQSINFTLDNMIKGLEALGDMQAPLNVLLENLTETIADKVLVRIKRIQASRSIIHARSSVVYCTGRTYCHRNGEAWRNPRKESRWSNTL